jgi:hypothetical protein
MRYQKIVINGKESLPKVDGKYFVNRSGFLSVMDYGGELSNQMWLKEVRYYLQPLPQTEISDEEIDMAAFDLCRQHSIGKIKIPSVITDGCWIEGAQWMRSQLSRIEPEKEQNRCPNCNAVKEYESNGLCKWHCKCGYAFEEQPVSEEDDEAPKYPTSWRDFTMTDPVSEPESIKSGEKMLRETIKSNKYNRRFLKGKK